MNTRRFRWGIASIWVVVGLVLIAASGLATHWRRYVRSPLPDGLEYVDVAPATGMIEIDFEVNRPGLDNPSFADAHDARILNSLRVIGVVVGGRPYAYSITALSVPPKRTYGTDVRELARRHVVNQLLGDTAVSVTYCDISRCARVFVMDQQTQGLGLGVGGLANGQLVLACADKNYLQTSEKIPLADCPHEVTFWADWVSRHPNSRIYLGE